MAIFAFGVIGDFHHQQEFIPPFKIANKASECPGSTWHNRINEDPLLDKLKNNFYYLALVNDN